MEELNDLTGIWNSLLPVYNNIDELKEIPWLSVQSGKLRQNLEELLARLKSLPSQYRSYDSYDCAKRMLQNYLKMNALVIELKPDSLKERHWRREFGERVLEDYLRQVKEYWSDFCVDLVKLGRSFQQTQGTYEQLRTDEAFTLLQTV